VSVNSRGVQGNTGSYAHSITPDGRFVAFASSAGNFVPGDSNGQWDVFVRDRRRGTTERVSVDSSGREANNESYDGHLSANGRYVAFMSEATNLVPGDTNLAEDVFVHDRASGTTERVSVASNGTEANGDSYLPSISADGRYVAFVSTATNLVTGDTNQSADMFVHDRLTGITERVSVNSNGGQASGLWVGDDACQISADGRYVAFVTDLSTLVPGDTNGVPDAFVHDRRTGTTERVSVSSTGTQQQYNSDYDQVACCLSADGRYVAFNSPASNLVPGDTNGALDVFVRDRQSGTTERVSVSTSGLGGNLASGWSSISDDGRYVAFWSSASNLVPGDTNGFSDVFVRDRRAGTTELVSIGVGSGQGNSYAYPPWISGEGRFVAFSSDAANLVPGDTNGTHDAFVRDRLGGPNFTSLCDPGIAGVIGCPCANPPSGPDHGCDNSSGTGGAVLFALGGTFLSSDFLDFTTRGELPTSLSILTQWTGVNSSGAIFGQGVRCTSGTFKRLYTKAAVAGSITAPDFNAGDPQVSVRSEARGDTILAGQSRWYLVYYRDPIVLGGCPASSTFNATQTGQVTWRP
jgi:Tol biopolymer transport system component